MNEAAFYILDGAGYEIHDGVRYDWEAGDVIDIPPCTIYQHFHADPARPARLISCINRIYKIGVLNDLEQIENAPEYDPGVLPTAELVRKYLTFSAKTRA